jgi:hypothetical protein
VYLKGKKEIFIKAKTLMIMNKKLYKDQTTYKYLSFLFLPGKLPK